MNTTDVWPSWPVAGTVKISPQVCFNASRFGGLHKKSQAPPLQAKADEAPLAAAQVLQRTCLQSRFKSGCPKNIHALELIASVLSHNNKLLLREAGTVPVQTAFSTFQQNFPNLGVPCSDPFPGIIIFGGLYWARPIYGNYRRNHKQRCVTVLINKSILLAPSLSPNL